MDTIGENSTSRREMALMYAKEGWPVLPLHSTVGERCTCDKKSCGSRGKHPRTKHGVKDATRDTAQITKWWTRWPDANIGLATGKVSGRLVLDIDIKKGKRGDESLRLLEEQYGPLPETRKSVTASGGWHYVFRMPTGSVKS
jgi:putative DNA primase/helicase